MGVTVLMSSRSSIGVSERRIGIVVVLDFDTGVIVPGNGVVVVAVAMAWNATNALYELSGLFFCGVLVLVLVRRRFGAGAVVDVDTGVIVSGNGVVVVAFAIAWNTTNDLYELA